MAFAAPLTSGPAQIEFHARMLICLWQPLGVSPVTVRRQGLRHSQPLHGVPVGPSSLLLQMLLHLGLGVASAPHPR